MTKPLVDLLARKFIARPDIKVQQHHTGAYSPVRDRDKNYIPFRRTDLEAHLAGTQTYGHYVVNQEDKCKFFCFDIDLVQEDPKTNFTGFYPDDFFAENPNWLPCSPRDIWRDRKHSARPYLKSQLRMIAEKLASFAYVELNYQVGVCYSGSKGLHVYCFLDGGDQASVAREDAQLVLDTVGEFDRVRGGSFYKHKDQTPAGYPNISVEVYPKQSGTESGKHLGNLLRLPLGKNLKNPKDPTFFLDLRAPFTDFIPVDSVWALTTKDPWEG